MAITLTFHGAAGTVTGSCFLLEAGSRRVLIDCGLFQGDKTLRELNYGGFPFDPGALDAVLLTHAHIDHSGLIPKLAKLGYHGEIQATPGTVDLLHWMLPDSGMIQESEVERLNRRNQRRARGTVTPIYTRADAEAALKQFKRRDFETWFDLAPGIRARFWNAGHILGAASIELSVSENGRGAPLSLLFSGDLGPEHKAFQQPAESPHGLDYVVMESTYGGKPRQKLDPGQRRGVLAGEVNAALQAGGNLLIPAFAVERTQELLADLVQLMHEGKVPRQPIFIDSPLATNVTTVFEQYLRQEAPPSGERPKLEAGSLHFVKSAEESRQIEQISSGAIIIAASGMCEAGRIRHHLRNNLWRPQATVLLIGYQSPGTLGSLLEQGTRAVRIHGEEIAVQARIRKLEIYSGHADHDELLEWARERLPIRRGLFLVHGEADSIANLRAAIAQWQEEAPFLAVPHLDEAWRLDRPRPAPLRRQSRPRLDPVRTEEALRGRDWHNDYAALMIDVQRELRQAKDDRERQRLLKRMQRALGR